MATTDAAPAEARRPTLTSTDLVAGVPVVVVGVLGTVSLALAHAHHHSLPAVLLVTLLALAALLPLVRRVGVRADRNGTIAVLACGLLAGVMFLPGFSYGVSDKDPGGYVAHSVEIARNGSYSFTDPALAHPTLPVEVEGPGARFAGICGRRCWRPRTTSPASAARPPRHRSSASSR
jgi:hypothetical protein